jgi:hypothetical protein
MNERVLPHGVLELDADIGRGANGLVRRAMPCGMAVSVVAAFAPPHTLVADRDTVYLVLV